MDFKHPIENLIETHQHKLPAQLREDFADFMLYHMSGYCRMEQIPEEEYQKLILDILAINTNFNINKNFSTNSFFKDNFPHIYSNKAFPHMMRKIYNIKQKSYGAGEALLSIFLGDIQQSGKIGDFILEGKHVEVKSLVSAASIKSHESSSFRPSNKKFAEIYGKKQKGTSQLWNGTVEKFRQYMSTLYPHISQTEIDQIYNIGEHNGKQELGIKILNKYKEIDSFDNLICIKLRDNDITFVNIADFNDCEFINRNLNFKPSLYRGLGTQALGDGYADITLAKEAK